MPMQARVRHPHLGHAGIHSDRALADLLDAVGVYHGPVVDHVCCEREVICSRLYLVWGPRHDSFDWSSSSSEDTREGSQDRRAIRTYSRLRCITYEHCTRQGEDAQDAYEAATVLVEDLRSAFASPIPLPVLLLFRRCFLRCLHPHRLALCSPDLKAREPSFHKIESKHDCSFSFQLYMYLLHKGELEWENRHCC